MTPLGMWETEEDLLVDIVVEGRARGNRLGGAEAARMDSERGDVVLLGVGGRVGDDGSRVLGLEEEKEELGGDEEEGEEGEGGGPGAGG